MTDLDTDGTTSRRAVLRGAAVGGLALPLLAACGSSSDNAGSSSSPTAGSSSSDATASPDGGSSGGSSSGGTTVAAADVPVGGGIVVKADKIVVTQPTKGTYQAFSAICTHQGCVVAKVAGGQIVCPCHGSHFSIKDGAPVAGPAQAPLAAKKVSVSGGQISVS